MFPTPRIIGFSVERKEVFVDWGWARSWSPVPQVILDDPAMPRRAMREVIATLEPARWVPHLTSAIWPQSAYNHIEDEEDDGDSLEHWRDSLEVTRRSFYDSIKQTRLGFKIKAVVFSSKADPLHVASYTHADVVCRRSDFTRFWSGELGLTAKELDEIFSDASQLDIARTLDLT